MFNFFFQVGPSADGFRTEGILLAHTFSLYVKEIMREVFNDTYSSKLGKVEFIIRDFVDNSVVNSAYWVHSNFFMDSCKRKKMWQFDNVSLIVQWHAKIDTGRDVISFF